MAVLKQGCKLSMDGKGAWRDNVFVEQLWRSLKYERVYVMAYDSMGAARPNIAQYFDWQRLLRMKFSKRSELPRRDKSVPFAIRSQSTEKSGFAVGITGATCAVLFSPFSGLCKNPVCQRATSYFACIFVKGVAKNPRPGAKPVDQQMLASAVMIKTWLGCIPDGYC